jgi:hypothetical protein
VFLTNLDVNDEIRLEPTANTSSDQAVHATWWDRNRLRRNQAVCPWTTSKEYAVRLFHIGCAMLLYDLWLLVNLLVLKFWTS